MERLGKMVASAPQCAAQAEQDPRLTKLLQEMGSITWSTSNMDTSLRSEEKLSLSNIMVYTQRSMPPCMRNLIETMARKKHLKYTGRCQILPFLRQGGLPLDEARV